MSRATSTAKAASGSARTADGAAPPTSAPTAAGSSAATSTARPRRTSSRSSSTLQDRNDRRTGRTDPADRRAVPGRVADARRPARPPADLGGLREQRPAAPRAADRAKKLTALSVRDVRLMVDDLGRPGSARAWSSGSTRRCAPHSSTRSREELVTRNVARGVRDRESAEGHARSSRSTAEEARAFLRRRSKDHRLYGAVGDGAHAGAAPVRGVRPALVGRRPRRRHAARSGAASSGLEASCGSYRPRPGGRRRTVPLPPFVVHALPRASGPAGRGAGKRGRGTGQDTAVRVHLDRRHTAGAADADPHVPSAAASGTDSAGPAPRSAAHLREPAPGARGDPRVVMEIVGHSAIEMTMNVYGHVSAGQPACRA